FCFFCFYCSVVIRDLRSFPTRRSSDLWVLKFGFDVFVLYLCLDIYRLGKTANGVSEALIAGDVHEASAQLRELTGKGAPELNEADRKSTRLNSSHLGISYAVFCLKKKT